MLENFRQLSISRKLKLPLLVLSGVIALSSLVGLLSVRALSTHSLALANQYLPALNQVLQADRDLFRAQVAERSLIFMNARADDFKQMMQEHANNVETSRTLVEQFITVSEDEKLKSKAADYLALHAEWSKDTNRIKEERAADTRIGRTNAMELSFGPAMTKFTSMREILHEVGDTLIHNGVVVASDTNQSQTIALVQQILAAIIGLGTCFAIIRFFPHFILEPMDTLTRGMAKVKEEGDFSFRINVTSKDEFGVAARNFNELVASLEKIILQCENAVTQMAQGRFDCSIDVSFHGDLNRLAQGINSSLVTVKQAMESINGITRDLAEGQFSIKSTQPLSGEFERTIAHANHAKQSLREIVNECSSVVTHIAAGDFSTALEKEYPGDLAQLKMGVNSTVVGMRLTMQAIRDAMDALEQGRFDYRNRQPLSGEFQKTLDSTTQAMSQLDATMTNIALVMENFAKGFFDLRVTADAKGAMENLKNQINLSLKAFERNTEALKYVMAAIAAGDLTKKVDVDCEGSFDHLKSNMNTITVRLTETLSEIRSTSDEVSQSAAELNNGSSDLSCKMEQQVASIEQTHTILQNIAKMSSDSAQFAGHAVVRCKEASRVAKEGETAVDNVIGAVKEISESSQKIDSIIGVIDGIAFQTNLLALNAAVEAARAGEQGRGFAVVAGEVRQLAQRSSAAAREIKLLVKEITERVDTGTRLAGNSGVVLKRVFDEVVGVNEQINKISAAISQQQQGIGHINDAVRVIEQATQSTAQLAEEVASASKSLSDQSVNLLEMASTFKVAAR